MGMGNIQTKKNPINKKTSEGERWENSFGKFSPTMENVKVHLNAQNWICVQKIPIKP